MPRIFSSCVGTCPDGARQLRRGALRRRVPIWICTVKFEFLDLVPGVCKQRCEFRWVSSLLLMSPNIPVSGIKARKLCRVTHSCLYTAMSHVTRWPCQWVMSHHGHVNGSCYSGRVNESCHTRAQRYSRISMSRDTHLSLKGDASWEASLPCL